MISRIEDFLLLKSFQETSWSFNDVNDVKRVHYNTLTFLVSCNLRKPLARYYTSFTNGHPDATRNARLPMLTGFCLRASSTTLSLPR